jgi:hypothetical protein
MKPKQNEEEYFLECINVEPLAIQDEYARIPADLAYWNEQFAEKQKNYRMAELRLDTEKARLYIQIRERKTMVGHKVTEAQVDTALEIDPSYLAARKELILAEAAMQSARGKCEAVRSKREMLISIGAGIRAEMAGDPIIRDQARSKRQREEG